GTAAVRVWAYPGDVARTPPGGPSCLAAKSGGDNSYTASTSATDTFTVTPAATSMSLSVGGSPTVGTADWISLEGAMTAPGGVTPTGTTSFYEGTTLIAGPAAISGFAGGPGGFNPPFTVNSQVTLLTAGDHRVAAKYSGDANYAAQTSNAVTVHARYPTTSSITASATTLNYPQSVTVTATVSSGQKSPAISGNITFYSNLGQIPAGTTTQSADGSGNLILQSAVTFTPQQSGWIYASYYGDANYAGSPDSGVLINVNIPDFSLSPASGVTVVPAAGQPASAQLSVTPATQTPSTVQLSLLG